MATMQIDGGRQIQAGTVTDTEIASGAAISLSKLAEPVIEADGGQAFTADQSMGSNKLTNLADGTAATDAVTKQQLDAVSAGLSWKQAVRVASSANLASLLSITAADFDGQGQGVTLVSGDRVLLKAQTAGAENGIYEYDGTDLNRATDMDGGTEADGAAVFVQEGDSADAAFTQTADAVTIGTTAMVWTQFTGLGQITAGAGLTKTGNTLDVGAGDGISVAADSVAVDASALVDTAAGITQTSNNFQVLLDAAGGLEFNGTSGIRLEAAVAGDGLAHTTGVLSVNVDGTGIEIATDTLQLKDNGTTAAKLADLTSGQLFMNTGSGMAAATWVSGELVNEVPNDSLTAFTVDNAFLASTVSVYINGLRQRLTTDYTLSGSTVTFTTAPATGDDIRVSYIY